MKQSLWFNRRHRKSSSRHLALKPVTVDRQIGGTLRRRAEFDVDAVACRRELSFALFLRALYVPVRHSAPRDGASTQVAHTIRGGAVPFIRSGDRDGIKLVTYSTLVGVGLGVRGSDERDRSREADQPLRHWHISAP